MPPHVSVWLIVFPSAAMRRRKGPGFTFVRMGLGRFLALGLEFQLAADLMRTAVAPSFDQIGKLAAIAAIRTGLNFFLDREMKEERGQLATEAE